MTPQPHRHSFLGEHHRRNETRTWLVIALTTVMMVGEIVAGHLFGSMALEADGWHMATHAGALIIAALAYLFARRHADDTRFAFGTAKLGDLAGFASAIILAMIALLIALELVGRLREPVPIAFDEAILVAVLGLLVNLASAWLLHEPDPAAAPSPASAPHRGSAHSHAHSHGHAHGHGHGAKAAGQPDYNLRGAYLHVIADAATSVAAIIGLLAGRFYGWVWMDAAMALLGSMVIASWSLGLIRDSGAVLLDVTPDPALAERVRQKLEAGGERIIDLHLWRLGPGHHGLIASLVTADPHPPEIYRARLASLSGLSHITIEVHPEDGPTLH